MQFSKLFLIAALTSVTTLVTVAAQALQSESYRPRPTAPKSERGQTANQQRQQSQRQQKHQNPVDQPGPVADDSDLIRAVADRRNVHFVQAAGVVVTRVLPDDTQGLPHQKWYVKLSNGQEVIAVYNSDMGQRVPTKPGTVMSLGGEFKMTNIGPMVHWLHYDPRGTRPDGYVIVNGVRYGDK